MAQSEAGKRNWDKVKGWARKAADTVNSLPLTPFDPIKAGKELTRFASLPIRVGESAQAAIDRKAGKIPAGVVKSPNAPRSTSGPGKARRAKANERPPGASPVGKAKGSDKPPLPKATSPGKRAAPPSAGPKTKDGKPSQMPASAARSVPSGKAPVPKARPVAAKAKSAAPKKAPVPMARPQSGPGRKPTTQPAKSANPNVARTAAPTPQKPVDVPWWKRGANTPFRRGPLASQDK